jgi:SOS-response transcriptional repressor LexA
VEGAKRPSKKQYELLRFVENFVAERGYGPSYREIMSGCNYSSVATVALHVNNLISKGHLRKKDRSARSLEVVEQTELRGKKIRSNIVSPSEEKWLIEQIEYRFSQAENGQPDETEIEGLEILVGALKVLGLAGAATSFTPRLVALRDR